MKTEFESVDEVAEYAMEQANVHEQKANEADRETDKAFHEGHVQAYHVLAGKISDMEVDN
jgi:hypothetical protein